MRVKSSLLFATGLLCTAPLLIGAKNPAASPADMTERQLIEAADRSEDDLAAACRSLVYTDELERRRADPGSRGLAARRRGVCAWHSKRYADAVRELQVAESVFGPDDPAKLRGATDLMLMLSASELKDWPAMERHALHVAKRNDAGEFADLDFDLWRFFLFAMPPAERGRIAIAFARTPAFGELETRVRGLMAHQAVKPALAAGDQRLALKLATFEPDPTGLVRMLIDRSYTPIWPQLAAHVGPKLGKELTANLTKAESELAATPDDLQKLGTVVRAQLFLNRPAEAVAIADRASRATDAFTDPDEHFGWLIDAEVMALDMLGQTKDGGELYNQLVAAGPEDGRGWMVNFAINRADRLIRHGRWAEALPAAELAVTIAAEYGSLYAKEVAAVDRYCAAVKLDPKRTELAAWWAEIEAGRLANIGSAVQAAKCKGDDAAAKSFFRDGLSNADSRAQALMLMQTPDVSSYRDEGNMFAEPRLLFLADPALMALFNRYGRILPEALTPSAYRP
jgi:tetratricopeptide (TPR) repeat protein